MPDKQAFRPFRLRMDSPQSPPLPMPEPQEDLSGLIRVSQLYVSLKAREGLTYQHDELPELTLQTIPGEIRLMIYGYLLPPFQGSPRGVNCKGLRLSCKQLKAEFEHRALKMTRKFCEDVQRDWHKKYTITDGTTVDQLGSISVCMPKSYLELGTLTVYAPKAIFRHGFRYNEELSAFFPLHLDSLALIFCEDRYQPPIFRFDPERLRIFMHVISLDLNKGEIELFKGPAYVGNAKISIRKLELDFGWVDWGWVRPSIGPPTPYWHTTPRRKDGVWISGVVYEAVWARENKELFVAAPPSLTEFPTSST
ncbi:hypothetical protein GQ43DRAFT_469097 [Delitschia confertaspora ATCC 74209]|uniref:Uncharacterized protein n=1 Tax=Delitschia confertaspora ATCC 74209 TaxID=1513339 RepID=A0A9P4JSN4_9PLEO|nr:hypothetical protein GQ43DRAFT_469097 [Delitschia confertaspora ATCC 74209]